MKSILNEIVYEREVVTMRSEKKFKVAAVQMNCELGQVEKNLLKAERLVMDAVGQGAKLIVLPELFNTGYRVESEDFLLAESLNGRTVEWMKMLAKKMDIVLVAAIIEKGEVDGVVYDTAVLVDKKGLVNKYRKIYLWDQENMRFKKGAKYHIEKVNDMKIGLQICYEVGFPEGARILTMKGANILVYPSAFGKKRFYAWDVATRSRALENGCYVIAANRIGLEKNETEFGGKSRIISPQGEVLVGLDFEEGVALAEVDLGLVEEQRAEIPYLRDLDFDLYRE